jgi:hypothetical protein
MAKSGSRGKIQDRCCHGLSASAANQRRTVDADTEVTMPRRVTSVARSGQLHLASGTSLSAGISHARAFTSATTAAESGAVFPGVGDRTNRPRHACRTGVATCERCHHRHRASARSRRWTRRQRRQTQSGHAPRRDAARWFHAPGPAALAPAAQVAIWKHFTHFCDESENPPLLSPVATTSRLPTRSVNASTLRGCGSDSER